MTQTMIDFRTAKLSGKPKLLLDLLRQRPLTSIEISEGLRTCCPATDVCDIRKHFKKINSKSKIKCEYMGMSPNKKRIFRYTLMEEG